MRRSNLAFAALACGTTFASPLQSAPRVDTDPMRFFIGRTEAVTTMKIVARKPFVTRSIGFGRLKPDGTLELRQLVKEDGKPQFERLWQIRRVGPDRYSGKMSQAKGPVTIERVADRFVFRFAMDGGLQAEQWVQPAADLNAAKMSLTIRKLGIRVAHSEGWIRRSQALTTTEEPKVPDRS